MVRLEQIVQLDTFVHVHDALVIALVKSLLLCLLFHRIDLGITIGQNLVGKIKFVFKFEQRVHSFGCSFRRLSYVNVGVQLSYTAILDKLRDQTVFNLQLVLKLIDCGAQPFNFLLELATGSYGRRQRFKAVDVCQKRALFLRASQLLCGVTRIQFTVLIGVNCGC